MNQKSICLLIVLLAVLSGFFIGFNQIAKENNITPPDNQNNVTPDNKEDLPDENPIEEVIPPTPKEPVKVKAIYLTGWSSGTKSIREKTINNLLENGFNSVVIDIKDEDGRLSYNSEVQDAIDVSASQGMIRDIKSVIQEFKDNDIYVIGRIVTFKDPTFASKKTEYAYKNLDGNTWKDYAGNAWPNPYNEKYWNYPISLAKEAATLGFDEIQFDYVRFPSSEGKVKQISYGFDSATKTKSDIISSYLTKVMEEMKDYDVVISADVFGIVTKKDGDFENIGQDFARIASIVDVICPMVYPSHYATGEYGVTYPDKEPYKIVYNALKDANKRLENVPLEDRAIIRPYLQDFSASWLGKGKYILYTSDAVKDQIQACYDLKLDEFILWDPNNKYAYDALGNAVWSDEIPIEETTTPVENTTKTN